MVALTRVYGLSGRLQANPNQGVSASGWLYTNAKKQVNPKQVRVSDLKQLKVAIPMKG